MLNLLVFKLDFDLAKQSITYKASIKASFMAISGPYFQRKPATGLTFH